jgi:hypothetical protein
MTIKGQLLFYIGIISITFLSGCGVDDPQKEDVPELITKVTLTFTPTTGTPVVVTATDPDGEGIQGIKVDGPINLTKSMTYVMSISLINALASPSDDAYDITKEVEEEGDEHMFFFSWTGDAFSDPTGNGNIDARADAINYSGGTGSKDANNLPLGLQTTWKASSIGTIGASIRVLLKHQPGLKTVVSGSDVGETDLDVTFQLNIN